MAQGNMSELTLIYQDSDLLVVEKPAGIICFPENEESEPGLIAQIIKQFPDIAQVGSAPRFGIAHRLDKETSGILLVARNNEMLAHLQKCFEDRQTQKKYLTLVAGQVKQKEGEIDALIGRNPSDRTKQAAFLPIGPQAQKTGLRSAQTSWKKVQEFRGFTLLEAMPKTGRRHQIRVHMAFIGHPIAGDKLYSFKGQETPMGLNRHFLHAAYLKIPLPDGTSKEFRSPLPPDLQQIIDNLEKQ